MELLTVHKMFAREDLLLHGHYTRHPPGCYRSLGSRDRAESTEKSIHRTTRRCPQQ